uniref:Uncharacterized protein n=1 Tax=Musa acuminata subsp. malaccensis TaxID=214687 RepID=A0A804HMK8_MUSAM
MGSKCWHHSEVFLSRFYTWKLPMIEHSK